MLVIKYNIVTLLKKDMRKFKVFLLTKDNIGVLPICLFEADEGINADTIVSFYFEDAFVGQISNSSNFYIKYEDEDGYGELITIKNRNYIL
jgi:hypothetical protein